MRIRGACFAHCTLTMGRMTCPRETSSRDASPLRKIRVSLRLLLCILLLAPCEFLGNLFLREMEIVPLQVGVQNEDIREMTLMCRLHRTNIAIVNQFEPAHDSTDFIPIRRACAKGIASLRCTTGGGGDPYGAVTGARAREAGGRKRDVPRAAP